MARDSCMARIAAGAAVGGAVGGAVGAVYGTYEAIRYKLQKLGLLCRFLLNVVFRLLSTSVFTKRKARVFYQMVPGLLKIRHIGQTTLGSAAVFGLFLGAGSLIHCGKSY